MDHLGILTERDRVAVVTRVFWRYVSRSSFERRSDMWLPWGQVYSSNAHPSVHLLAGTGWLSWCLGFRRLPFSPIPVWQCPIERLLQSLEGEKLCSTDSDFIGHKFLRPKSIHQNEIVEEYSKDYMYLACIYFINSVSAIFGVEPLIV